MALVGIFGIILATLCLVVARRRLSRNRRKVIRSWPLIGMLPSLLSNMNRLADWMIEVAGRRGGTLVFKGPWFTGLYAICTTDPENIKHIMSTNFCNYPKGSEFKEMYSDILGDGIFNSDSDLWKNQRKSAVSLINHERFQRFLFHTAHVKVEKGLFPVLEHICTENKEIDLQDLVHRFTADVTFILVTGLDRETLSIGSLDDKLGFALDCMEEALFYRHFQSKMLWKFQNWLGIGTERKVKAALKTVDEITTKYISMRRQGRVGEGVGVDLLSWRGSEDKRRVEIYSPGKQKRREKGSAS
ncbi:alkane hydroxylase MAH1 isoform X2 [Jatropha curcas]|uniref:alkane hydroxylase MAH1 isoform X2 n=1 Tax=Jatropha curcas TaxID=180498 RepID=UPI0005FBDC12|nr:alkane hydroxylase MAH1 isoform X2 [Jatropha curcas]